MLARISLFLLWISTSSSRIVNFAGYQLDDMALCELGWPFSDYDHYGCACSEIIKLAAVDQVDQCCERHNECYEAAHSECLTLSPYYAFYSYKCDGKKITCKDSIHTCAGTVCNCDKSLMDCLQKYPRPVAPFPRCHITAAAIFRYENRTNFV